MKGGVEILKKPKYLIINDSGISFQVESKRKKRPGVLTPVNPMGDFCTRDAMKRTDSGHGLAEGSAWAHGLCPFIYWTKFPIWTKVFCGEDTIYELRRGRSTFGDILCDFFMVSWEILGQYFTRKIFVTEFLSLNPQQQSLVPAAWAWIFSWILSRILSSSKPEHRRYWDKTRKYISSFYVVSHRDSGYCLCFPCSIIFTLKSSESLHILVALHNRSLTLCSYWLEPCRITAPKELL